MTQSIEYWNNHILTTAMLVLFGWMGLFDFEWEKPVVSLDLLEQEFLVHDIRGLQIEPDMRILIDAVQVESRRVDSEANHSDLYQALHRISGHADAAKVFLHLASQSNDVAQVYGLAGLRLIDSERFSSLFPHLQSSNKTIQFQAGCSCQRWLRPNCQNQV